MGTMVRQVVQILVLGFVLRLVVFTSFPGVSASLDEQVEVTTAISSYKRLEEGLFQYMYGSNSHGSICYQSPLLISLFSLFPSQLWVDVAYSATDVFIAACLATVAEKLNRKHAGRAVQGYIVAAFYLLNPYTLMSSLARSTNTFSNAAIAGSLMAAVSARPYQSMYMLSLASVLSIYPLYLLPPMLLLSWEFSSGKNSQPITGMAKYAGFFLCSCGLFLGLAHQVSGSMELISNSYEAIWYLKELSPNIGLWWYFFTEMFDYFRPFFIGVFQLFIACFSVPITIRFKNDAVFAVTALSCLITIFKPYPEIGDVGFYFALLALNRSILKLLRYSWATILALLYVSLLGPTFYHLWVYLGSGNANFFFAITLVYAIAMTNHLSDILWAAIRYEYDGGKNPNLSQI